AEDRGSIDLWHGVGQRGDGMPKSAHFSGALRARDQVRLKPIPFRRIERAEDVESGLFAQIIVVRASSSHNGLAPSSARSLINAVRMRSEEHTSELQSPCK